MSRLDRYLFREIATPTLIALSALTFVMFARDMGRFLEIVVLQSASAREVWQLALALLPNALMITIPMSTLVGILTGFGRMSSDHEVVALRAAGVSMRRILRPVLGLALLSTLAGIGLSVWVAPQSGARLRQLSQELAMKQVSIQLTPRVFNERLKDYKLYVQDAPGPWTWKGIMLANVSDPDNPKVWLAESGALARDENGRRYQLTLNNGITLLGEPRSSNQTLDYYTFDRTTVTIDMETINAVTHPTTSETPTRQLWNRMRASETPPEERTSFQSEFHRRLAIPCASLAFALIGLPLGVSTARGSKSVGLVLSLILMLAYYLAVIAGTGNPNLPPALAAWAPNIVFAAFGLILLARSDQSRENRFLIWLADLTSRATRLISFRKKDRTLPKQRAATARGGHSKIFRLLDAYVLRGFWFYYGLVLAAFISLYIVVTLFNLLPDIISNKVGVGVVVKYFAWLIPYILYLMAPLAMLLGILVALGTLTKTNEILAVKAGAISLYRLSLPLIAMGLILSGAVYAMQDFLLPYSNQRQDEYRDQIKGRAPQTYRDPQRKWMMGAGDRMYHYNYFDPDQDLFGGVTLYEFEPNTFDLREWIYAKSGQWNRSAWNLNEGWIRRRGPDGKLSYEPFNSMTFTGLDTPDYFKKEVRTAQQMTYQELKKVVEDLNQSGFDVRRIRVDLYRKLSFPLATFIMTLIGIPFSFATGKKGAFHGIGISLALGILYWATFELFNKLGDVDTLSPMVAAWFPNLIFGCGGLWLMLRLKT
ncbi:MAG TPA: LPS export ABC transporter permease LptG [Terriglobia bacterium]|nr:LPS export ABC transporter permease LptG [Terriglobia bacterium]